MPGNSHQRRIFQFFCCANTDDNADIENLRKVFLVNLFSTVGMAFLLGYGVVALIYHRTYIATVTLPLAALTLLNYLLMLRLGKHNLGAHAISLIMAFLFFFLLCTGGVDSTGPLWCYSAAPFLLFIYGVRWGAISVALLIIGACVLLYLPNPLLIAEYTDPFKNRFIASFLAVAVMSYLHEYSRYRSYRALLSLRKKVEQEARTDALTGLTNRRHMYDYMHIAMKRMRRMKLPLSLLLIDIDNFKLINDNYGHQFGDEVLTRVAHCLRQHLRDHDSIARWGGEEFLVLLSDADNDAAMVVAEKLRSTIELLPIEYNDTLITITISIGLHTILPEETMDDMLNRADQNLYIAKHSGRNRIINSCKPAN